MQNRKDLLQAHRLMTQRAGLALLLGEPDSAEYPLRRMNVATFAGLMIAALMAGVFGIVGLLTHSGAQVLRAAGTLVIDKDTGTSYVWCQSGRLCPALNNASARLALASAAVNVREVSQSSLARYPRGPEFGIPGLPPLPSPGELIRGPWSVCVRTVTSPAGPQPVVTLVAGTSVGGRPVQEGELLLVSGQGQDWVIWNDLRMAITRQDANAVVGPAGQQPVVVPASWLTALREGPPFAPPAIPGIGRPTRHGLTGHATIGQVYRVAGPAQTQWYVQLADGVAQISQTQAQLLGTEVGNPVPASLSAATSHLSAAVLQAGGLPGSLPKALGYDPATPLCTVYGGAAHVPPAGQLTLGGVIPAGGLATHPDQAGGQGSGQADEIVLPPGTGALAGVITRPGQRTATTYFLVTGTRRYALATAAVAGYLGYQLPAQGTLVPVNIAGLIPQGPVLDHNKALQPVATR
jgi:type VII secretion protein EccB